MIRLEAVRTGHALKHKLMLGLGRFLIGAQPPDIMRILFHRHEFWGKPVGLLTQAVLRGASEWTVGERELFAALVSARNQCRFCTGAHAAIASRAIGGVDVLEIIEGRGRAALSPKVQAILPFIEKLTLEPDTVSPADVEELRAAGISRDAILDAAYVVMLFCMYNRIVDAIGCEPMEAEQLVHVSKVLLEKGYDL
jgi:uncharacterized peroxidase-related enzyme